MPKDLIDQRLAQLAAEGTELRAGVDIGGEAGLDPVELRAGVDAVVLATGALRPRDLQVPGRELGGVHQAMDYLPLANRVRTGDLSAPPIDAAGKQVVIIGGGDTAADCLGTANRQGAVSVTQLDHNPRPPEARDDDGEPVATVAEDPSDVGRARGGRASSPGLVRPSSSSGTRPDTSARWSSRRYRSSASTDGASSGRCRRAVPRSRATFC